MASCDGAETKKADSNFFADHFGGYEFASSSRAPSQFNANIDPGELGRVSSYQPKLLL
jgi:hypothetical protein